MAQPPDKHPDFTADGAILVFDKLCKNYQLGAFELKVLQEIDLVIRKGDYLAVMGPSGSGKSTLLNIIGCLDRPTSGKYFLGGQDVSLLEDNDLSAIRGRHVGFVFQSFNLISQLNIIENIEIPMFYQGFSEHQSSARAQELAELVGLGDRTRHRPSELSGGQQQRVAIARALANDPLIVLADEPTGNLDSQSGKEILALLDNLCERGKTLIVITHDENIAHHAQRQIRLLDGRIEKEWYNR
ncbi:MAG: ABC transporter ATP-binding protein [Sedimentisphaerales bacterium]|nr:ABC transporter ATP-binding protein [Sedimentisphaerales bacterium]